MTLNISSLSVIQACGYQGGDAVFGGIRGFISIYSSVFKVFLFHFFFLFVSSHWVSMQTTKGKTKAIT